MLRVFRICRARWADSTFDGEGARLAGGRFNHRGDRVVYTAESLALAAVELFVHLDPEDAPDDLVAVAATIPEDLSIDGLEIDDLPPNWRDVPAPSAPQDLGSRWIRSSESPVLRVPSVVIPREACYLINPGHADFKHLQVEPAEPFHFDPRLWKVGG